MLKDFYKNKRILITGHTGFKGAWLTQTLISMGANVIGYALKPDRISLFNDLMLENNMEYIYSDIRDEFSIKKVIKKYKPNIVFHLAAKALVRESYDNPVDTFSTNIMGTINLLEALRDLESCKSVVNITSDKVYMNIGTDKPYKETDILCGQDPYSNSKSCSELVTYSYRNSFYTSSNTSISTARAGNVIGGGDFSADRILPDCIRFASEETDILLRNPMSIRPYQHVLECIHGYLILAMKQYDNKVFEGCYNFGPDEKDIVSTSNLADIFCKFWGNNQKWVHSNNNQKSNDNKEMKILKIDNTKAKDILDWKPIWDIEKAVRETVLWSKVYFYDKSKIKAQTERQIEEYFNEYYHKELK